MKRIVLGVHVRAWSNLRLRNVRLPPSHLPGRQDNVLLPWASCNDRKILWERYHEALLSYIEATNQLDTDLSGENFDHAYNIAVAARLVFEDRREQYNAHVAEHGCCLTPLPLAPAEMSKKTGIDPTSTR